MRRILLINTAAPDRPNGSMVRYGRMVREALERHGGGSVAVEEINLAPRQAWVDHFPARLRTPLRYLWIAANARRRLPRQRECILHLLDGSHAYFLGAVQRIQAPLVITVHDMIPALCLRGELDGQVPGRAGAWLISRAAANLRKANMLLTVSENTRADVMRITGAEPRRVRAVHSAAVSSGHSSARQSDRAEPPYILHVAGNNTFYKNRQGVIEVFQIIRKAEPIRLQMVGAPPDPALLRKVESCGFGHSIDFQSNVSEDELAALYRGAAFLLFPSLYEGFGWPPLEAMAHGCPVVCSDAGSLPEIAGSAALRASPADVEALAAHGLRLCRDGDLRRQVVDAGFRNVQRFRLDALAEGLLEVYDQAAALFDGLRSGRPDVESRRSP